MKLNKTKWLAEVRRVETELKDIAVLLKKDGGTRNVDSNKWCTLRAEATMLYMLRRACKGKVHEVKCSCQVLRKRHYGGGYYPSSTSRFRLGQELYSTQEFQDQILKSSWKDAFLVSEEASSEHPAPSQQPASGM